MARRQAVMVLQDREYVAANYVRSEPDPRPIDRRIADARRYLIGQASDVAHLSALRGDGPERVAEVLDAWAESWLDPFIDRRGASPIAALLGRP